jgi:hypothetical protein
MSRGAIFSIALLALLFGLMPRQGSAQDPDTYARSWSDRTIHRDPRNFAIPYHPVRCADYVDAVRPYAAGFERGPDRGQYGPRHALPALAVFAQTGDRGLANGIKQTLRYYGRWVDEQISEQKGVFSLEGATLLAIHFRELRARNMVSPDDERWLRKLLLNLRQYQFAWRPGDGLWRGSHHRAVSQGMAHLIAANYYPDERDASQWRAYGESVWRDWWSFRDIGINDTSYFYSSLGNILRTADLLGRTAAFTDPEVRHTLWDRLLFETTPDGVLIPYGAHAGRHGLAGVRIWALELAARNTGDGRYRYVASRLMNFGQARGFSPGQHHWHASSIEAIALAALACDDSVKPVRPDSGSRILTRPEIVRLTPSQSQKLFPEAGGVDVGMYMTKRSMPHKLVFRSGWDPGDMYMLVEAYPRHDPLNPTAILALERWSAAFAEMQSEKVVSRENAVRIQDLSGAARLAGADQVPVPRNLPIGFDRMESTVEAFADDALATHARLRVSNYMGYRTDQTREFLFIKNRFVLVRDESLFRDNFRARVGPIWNTQDIGRSRGMNWVDTWIQSHWWESSHLYENPPWNLLIYHAPMAATSIISIANEAAGGPPSAARMKTLQYAWEGTVRVGKRLQFTTLLVPHAADVDVRQLAAGIRVLRHNATVSAIAIEGPHAWELALLNEDGGQLTFATPAGTLVTDAKALYLEVDDRRPTRFTARSATFIKIGGKVLHRTHARLGAFSEGAKPAPGP